MSESVAFTIITDAIAAVPRLIQALGGLVDTFDRIPTSPQLQEALACVRPAVAAIATPSAVTSRLARLTSVDTKLKAVETRLLEVAEPGIRSAVASAVTQAQALVAADQTQRAHQVLIGAETAFAAASRGAVARLAMAEREAAVSVVSDALQDVHARVSSIANNAGVTGIHAEYGPGAILIAVRDGGRMELDLAGFEGGACIPAVNNLLEAIRARGGSVSGYTVQHHGDPAGGRLHERAAAHRSANQSTWGEAAAAVSASVTDVVHLGESSPDLATVNPIKEATR